MKVNPNKFQGIVIAPNKRINVELEFHLTGGVMITPSDNVKLLGVRLDNKLNFSVHIRDMLSKCAKQINVLARLSKLLSAECKMKMLNAFVMSNLNYCSTLYHFCHLDDAVKLEKLQKRALRYVLNDYVSPYQELLSVSKKDPLYMCRTRSILENVFKISHGLLPPMEPSFFMQGNHEYELRRSNTFTRPRPRTTHFGLNSLKNYGSKLWNDIPNNLRNIEDYRVFQKMLSSWNNICHCNTCRECRLLNV